MSVDDMPKDEAVTDVKASEAEVVEATEAAEAKLDAAADEVAADAAEIDEAANTAEGQLVSDDAPVKEDVVAQEPAAEVEEEAPVVRADERQERDPRPERPTPTRRRDADDRRPERRPERRPDRRPPQRREHNQGPRPAAPEQKKGIASLGMGAWIGIAVVALVLGIVVGKFLLGGGAAAAGGSLGGKLTVTESELDTPMATYTYKGTTSTITAREVILQNNSLDASKDADGNYSLPSADTVLSVARNAIIKKEAEDRGITVSDEELANYSKETLGSADYASIATSYSMTEDAVKELLTNSCIMSKLRDEVVEADTSATMPDAPKAPESTYETKTQVNEETGQEEEVQEEVDNSSAPSAEYAAYIIKLAGSEWNASTGTWASPDGPYATALSGYEITKDSATYEAAQAAYYVAYQQYSEAQSKVSAQWTDFVNGLLANASISISTLIA